MGICPLQCSIFWTGVNPPQNGIAKKSILTWIAYENNPIQVTYQR